MSPHDDKPEGFIVEFVRMGRSVKATAFDPVTLREASIIGDARAPQKALAELAARKLRHILKTKP